MPSLKERLQQRPDLLQQTVKLDMAGGEEVVIRRLTLGERNVLIGTIQPGQPNRDTEFGIALIAMSIVPPMTEADVLELPAAVADELGNKLMHFNGWTERSRNELADQFRATT